MTESRYCLSAIDDYLLMGFPRADQLLPMVARLKDSRTARLVHAFEAFAEDQSEDQLFEAFFKLRISLVYQGPHSEEFLNRLRTVCESSRLIVTYIGGTMRKSVLESRLERVEESSPTEAPPSVRELDVLLDDLRLVIAMCGAPGDSGGTQPVDVLDGCCRARQRLRAYWDAVMGT